MGAWAMLTAMKGGRWKVTGGRVDGDLSFFFEGATVKQTERMLDPSKTRFVYSEADEVRLGVVVTLSADGKQIVWPGPTQSHSTPT